MWFWIKVSSVINCRSGIPAAARGPDPIFELPQSSFCRTRENTGDCLLLIFHFLIAEGSILSFGALTGGVKWI